MGHEVYPLQPLRGPSLIRVTKERETETPESNNWMKVVDLVQTAFWYGLLAEEATWQTIVLIPKEGGDFWGLDLWRFFGRC